MKQSPYQCQSCGASYGKWVGQCGQCDEWNTVVENSALQSRGGARLYQLKDVDLTQSPSFRPTGVDYLDRLLGGGLPDASVVLLAGQPGAGKSTLLFEMFRRSTEKILYVSAEESVQQIARRFGDQEIQKHSNFYILPENRISVILAEIEKLKPDVVAVDSIQMLISDDLDRARGGNFLVREVSETLVTRAKADGFRLWLVGHVNKDGEIAGPKTLEHLVDTVLLFSMAEEPQVRILQTQKHRFGISGELALLEMSSQGLRESESAESFWVSDVSGDAPGCAFSAALLGSRVYCVEVQALCTRSHFPSPRRSASGFELTRLYLLLAVLEKRLKIPFSQLDVYLNLAGGLKITDTALDLAVAAALVSSYADRAQASGSVFCGEVGLTGEIRQVPALIQRVRACERMGRSRFLGPAWKAQEGLKSEYGAYANIKELFEGLLSS